MTTHFDVLIVGAGLSGIGTACQIQREFPGKRLAILERRNNLGGTWDLFKYPGIRSDSDMFSFGYKFRPWNETKVLADGPSIRQYIADTAVEFGVDKKIHYGVKILGADWSSEEKRWTLRAVEEATGEEREYSCRFLISCTGYYDQDAGFQPKFPGAEQFQGQCIHPQRWPESLDYSGKNVVVIGSGATAVTLVPAMAGTAAHVTMLQRSPSYVFSVPALDKISEVLGRFLPESWVYLLARKRNILIQRWASRVWNFVFLYEQGPVSPSRGNGRAEMTKVPRQDNSVAGGRHRHHASIDEIETRLRVPVDEIQCMTVLGVGWAIQLVNAFEQGTSEDERGCGMAAGAENEMDLHINWPRDDGSPSERCQKTCRELVALTLGVVASRDQRPAIAEESIGEAREHLFDTQRQLRVVLDDPRIGQRLGLPFRELRDERRKGFPALLRLSIQPCGEGGRHRDGPPNRTHEPSMNTEL